MFSRVLHHQSSHLIAPFPKVNLDSGGGVDGEPLVRVDRHAEQPAVCVDQLAHISKEERLRRMCPCFTFEPKSMNIAHVMILNSCWPPGFEIVQHTGLVEVGEVAHVLASLKLGRVYLGCGGQLGSWKIIRSFHLLDLILLQDFLFSICPYYHLNIWAVHRTLNRIISRTFLAQFGLVFFTSAQTFSGLKKILQTGEPDHPFTDVKRFLEPPLSFAIFYIFSFNLVCCCAAAL